MPRTSVRNARSSINYITLFMPGFQHYVAVSVAVSVTVSVKTVSVLVVPYAVAGAYSAAVTRQA